MVPKPRVEVERGPGRARCAAPPVANPAKLRPTSWTDCHGGGLVRAYPPLPPPPPGRIAIGLFLPSAPTMRATRVRSAPRGPWPWSPAPPRIRGPAEASGQTNTRRLGSHMLLSPSCDRSPVPPNPPGALWRPGSGPAVRPDRHSRSRGLHTCSRCGERSAACGAAARPRAHVLPPARRRVPPGCYRPHTVAARHRCVSTARTGAPAACRCGRGPRPSLSRCKTSCWSLPLPWSSPPLLVRRACRPRPRRREGGIWWRRRWQRRLSAAPPRPGHAQHRACASCGACGGPLWPW